MIHGNLGVGSEAKDGDWDVYHRLIAERRETKPYADRSVTITLTVVREKELKVVVADEGDGFDPKQLPDPTDVVNLDRVCGRGMLLIRTFFDEVTHNSMGNEITMIKRMVSE
jgi:anti-sigma regulatory factor (Ser/Thr protein kinase)